MSTYVITIEKYKKKIWWMNVYGNSNNKIIEVIMVRVFLFKKLYRVTLFIAYIIYEK